MNTGISIRELAFVRDVLIPRAWVRGTEADELVGLRQRIDQIFAGLGAPERPPTAEQPPRTKKPRHPKPGQGGEPSQERAGATSSR
ncbi:MAG: hypothetical protein KDD82_13795 [Planctomycetes bacterium]|nr:hypothetical protein [Planctomycetota bacterium]